MGDSVPEMSDRFSRELGFYTQSELRSQSSQAMLQAFADKRKSIKPATERCLYIGIDFGTTYSGVAWAWSGDLDNINVVTNWNTRGRNLSHIRDDAKAPTALYYEGDTIHWGHAITEDEDAIRWFKLLLLKDEDLQDDIRDSSFLNKAKTKLLELGITPEQAVADYLSLLWDHTMSSMKRARGAGAVDGLPLKVVLTVPAIWKPYAHEKMRNAARAAGILNPRPCGETTLKLVSEPEAAALATLNEFRACHNIKKGDVYVVCDVGGGTADIISYKIKETDPLILYEIVEGKGKLCGAVFVDEAFQGLIKSRIGQQKWEKLSRASKVKLMNDEWEFGIKRAFDGEPKKSWTCQLPPDAVGRFGPHRLDDRKADAPMLRGQIQFSTDHIRRVFSRVTNDIRGLILAQIKSIEHKEKKKPKAVILVGGFGACEYFYQILAKEHEKHGIEILQSIGKGPWTAICRGAVIRAASNVVHSRISRFSYGVVSDNPFVEGKHLESERYACHLYGGDWARAQMTWYVKKGQDIDVFQPLRFPFIAAFIDATLSNIHVVKVYQCEEDPSPPRLTPKVTVLCEIACRLDVKFEDLPQVMDTAGRPFREFSYEIELVREDAGLQFFLIYKGRRMASKDIQV